MGKNIQVANDAINQNTRILSVADVAKILRCSVPTVYKMIRKDGLPTMKLSGRRAKKLIPEYALMEWIKSKTRSEVA